MAPTKLPRRHYNQKDRPEDIVLLSLHLPRWIRDQAKANAVDNGYSTPDWCIRALEDAIKRSFRVHCEHPVRYRAGGICWEPHCHETVESLMDVGTEEEQPAPEA